MSLDSVTNVTKFSDQPLMLEKYSFIFLTMLGAPVAQWVKRWPTDLVDRVRGLEDPELAYCSSLGLDPNWV